MKNMSKILLVVIAAVFISACGDKRSGSEECTGPDCGTPPPAKAISLEQFESCDEADSFARDSLIAKMEESLDKELKEGCRYDYVMEESAVDTSDWDAGSVQVTATNVQEKGVDEADLVKTNGDYTFVLGDGSLHIVKTWPTSQLKEVSNIKIEGTPISMFLMDNKVVIFSAVYPEKETTGKMSAVGTVNLMSSSVSYWGSDTKLTFIDVVTPAKPLVTRESYYSGSFNAARRIGDSVYVVTMPSVNGPTTEYAIDDYKLYPICGVDGKPKTAASAEFKKAIEDLKEKNKKSIEKWILSDGLPNARHKLGGEMVEAKVSCEAISRSDVSIGSSLVSITMADVKDASAEGDKSEFVLGGSGTVYATKDSIYVANPENSVPQKTVIHRFVLNTEDGEPFYFGSGETSGWLLNQFSMSEYKGYLRVATTNGFANKGDEDVSSTVSVIDAQDQNMPVVGNVDGIGNGEQIKAVRFIGDRGFVVTFKKIDPLFVVDLRDPVDPKLAGELEVPGYSTYLHPLEDNHLIGLGKDADDEGNFAWFQGLKLSVFDVTSSLNPKEDASEVIGSRGTMSPALDNHLAFTFDADKGILALPLTLCEGANGGSEFGKFSYDGVQIYKIGADDGIELVSEIKEDTTGGNTNDYYDTCNGWYYSGNMLRTILIGDNASETSVIIIKNDGVSIYTIDGVKEGGVLWQ